MTYRITLLAEYTKLSDMSDNRVVIFLYKMVSFGNLSINGTMVFPKNSSPSPSLELVTYLS